jgi:uncharacterized membrane protein (TIGR02234 family)
VLHVSGRTLDAAPTALALVALAGVVAVLATRGVIRRVVGIVLGLSGAALVWRAIASFDAVSVGRARALVRDHHATVDLSNAIPHVEAHVLWPALTLACGVAVAVAGAVVAWRGHTWQVMSARYEAAPSPADDASKAAANLWTALDRGDDPTR